MLRSLGLGLGLEPFAKFLRVSVSVSENLVSEKSLGFGFVKFCLGKSLGFGFGKRKEKIKVTRKNLDQVNHQVSYLKSNLFLFCSYLLDGGKQRLLRSR